MVSFSLLVGFGAALGAWQVGRSAPPSQAGRWVDAALVTLLLALIGSRAAYVALEWPYYAARTGEIFAIWQGGLAWVGAVLGWLAGVLLVAGFWRISIGAALDGLGPLLTPLAVTTWLGCWQSGCAYAAALPAGAWWGLPAPDESGLVASRFPLQVLAALLILAHDWAAAAFLYPPKGSGLRAALSLAAVGVVIFIASLLWAQPTRRIGIVPLDGWFGLGVAATGVFYGLWYELVRSRILRGKQRRADGHQP